MGPRICRFVYRVGSAPFFFFLSTNPVILRVSRVFTSVHKFLIFFLFISLWEGNVNWEAN